MTTLPPEARAQLINLAERNSRSAWAQLWARADAGVLATMALQLLHTVLPCSCWCTELVPIAHTSTVFLAWIIISFARDLDNTRSIFHYGFLHSTPWSGFTFYCLRFIFMCFPSAVMFSLSPLMKSLSLLTVFKVSNTQTCSHSLYVLALLCSRYKPTPN